MSLTEPPSITTSKSSTKVLYLVGGVILLIALLCACWAIAKPAPNPSISQSSIATALPAALSKPPAVVEPPSDSPTLPAARPIPPGATDAQKAFLAAHDRLQADRMKLAAQLANATPEERQEVMRKWHTENAEALAAQQKLVQQMSAESASRSLPIPPEPRIPVNATPEMREAITARHALMKERMEMMTKLRDASPEERQQAMQNWHTQNADRLRAMRPPTSTPPTNPSPLPQQAH